jgi:hypothetical protein
MAMSQPVSALDGIGPLAAEVFTQAGYVTMGQLKAFRADDRRIQGVIERMKASKPEYPTAFWRRLGTRCANIIYRVQSSEAAPFVPSAFMCPLSLDWFTDPVVSPSGHSYERGAVVEWIQRQGTDPLTRQPITVAELYPNRALLIAQDYHRRHHLKY